MNLLANPAQQAVPLSHQFHGTSAPEYVAGLDYLVIENASRRHPDQMTPQECPRESLLIVPYLPGRQCHLLP